MSQQNTIYPQLTPEREREAAEARVELLRRADEQGVELLHFNASFNEGAEGQSQEEVQREVDDFLQMQREWREEEFKS